MVETNIVGIALILVGTSFFFGWYKFNRNMKSYLLVFASSVMAGITALILRHITSDPETISIVRSIFMILVGLSWLVFFIEEIIKLRRNNNEQQNS